MRDDNRTSYLEKAWFMILTRTGQYVVCAFTDYIISKSTHFRFSHHLPACHFHTFQFGSRGGTAYLESVGWVTLQRVGRGERIYSADGLHTSRSMCGIVALLLAEGNGNANQELYDSLTALQHRGQGDGHTPLSMRTLWSLCQSVDFLRVCCIGVGVAMGCI